MGAGEKLAAVMRAKGVTVAQLSDMTGLSGATIYRMLDRGSTRGYAESWQRVAICLGVPVSTFLG